LKKQSSAHGGPRKGADRRPGGQNEATLDKIAAREVMRQRVTAMLGPLIDAQLANALGIALRHSRKEDGEVRARE
jgi:hypothetical protein